MELPDGTCTGVSLLDLETVRRGLCEMVAASRSIEGAPKVATKGGIELLRGGAMDLVLSSLGRFGADAALQHAGALAVFVWARSCYKPARTILGEKGAVARLLAAMRQHLDHAGVQKAGCGKSSSFTSLFTSSSPHPHLILPLILHVSQRRCATWRSGAMGLPLAGISTKVEGWRAS